MARRKKEPEGYHRAQIAAAAEALFMENGISATTMDDIAKKAGYSKATLYVYFKNKDEIVASLVLKSMKLLHTYIHTALAEQMDTYACFQAICHAILQYYEQFPFYFRFAIGKISVDQKDADAKETFEIGETINQELATFLQNKMAAGALRPDLPVTQTVFLIWSMLSGFMQMASDKQTYIEQYLGIPKPIFLQNGFDVLYHSITKVAKE